MSHKLSIFHANSRYSTQTLWSPCKLFIWRETLSFCTTLIGFIIKSSYMICLKGQMRGGNEQRRNWREAVLGLVSPVYCSTEVLLNKYWGHSRCSLVKPGRTTSFCSHYSQFNFISISSCFSVMDRLAWSVRFEYCVLFCLPADSFILAYH